MSGAPFDILSREVEVGRPYFLEASAGTGKTFAIEHLVVRYLLEQVPPVTIDRILVVTFTRAATRELRLRIRRAIDRSLAKLERGDGPDYLVRWVEEGRADEARRRLSRALAAFDDAQIYTIHGFCSEMLREHAVEAEVGIDTKGLDGGLSHAEQLQVVLDFFRTGLDGERYSAAQLARALTLTRGDPRSLARLILSELGRGRAVVVGRTRAESLEMLNAALAQTEVRASEVLADFAKLDALFVGLRDRNRELKPTAVAEVERFAALLERGRCTEGEFEELLSMPITLLDLVANGRMLRGREWPSDLRCDWLYSWLRETFGPVIEEARDPRQILARMVAECRQMLGEVMEEQESLTFDGLLEAMAKALAQEKFRQAVGERFAVAVVDEFQDTDPTQWAIFRRLFVERAVPLVVVGDPKQSIYAFRSADIYSYLGARDVLGEESCRTLGVNYRSRPGLVTALNGLFGQAEGLIGLPSRGTTLPYVPVQAGIEGDNALSADGPIRIFQAESRSGRRFPSETTEMEQLFPFIVSEIEAIREQVDVPYSHFAVLIADRYQGERFRKFAGERGVPVSAGRGRMPADSAALEQLYVIYRAVLDPSDWGRVRAALTGQLIGWGVERVGALSDSEPVALVANQLAHLRETLMHRGFLPFYVELMRSEWGEEESVGVRLLRTDLGLYKDCSQLAEIIAAHESANRLSADGLLPYFQELRTFDPTDEQAPKLLPQTDDDAVHLMTTFASKGLEFGVVFALGLASRKGGAEPGLVACRGNRLAAAHESAEAAQLAAEEGDAEKARLLYVALTRAKDRVYIPQVTMTGKTKSRSSPSELLLARLPANLEGLEGVRCVQAVGEAADVWSADKPQLVRPREPQIHRIDRVLQSFTGLARPSGVRVEGVPTDRHAIEKTVHTLPAGATTGLLVHELLEETPLDLQKAARFVRERTEDDPWADVIGELVMSALQTPIDGFTLSEVDPRRTWREMEFLFGVRGEEGVALAPGCVGGVMDLFCEHRGRYYLIDWKTNWLGPDAKSYGPKQLAAAMEHHDYGLQARLYSEALKRYLRLVDDRPFDECFGGAYYVFLRGRGVIRWG